MEWKKLIDKALGHDFDVPQYDPKKGRSKLIKQIDTAAKQHTEGTTRGPKRSWKAGNNSAIEFAASVNGNPVLLDGDEKVYIPSERFQDFLAFLKKSVTDGDLDKEIKAAMDGEAPVSAPKSASRKRSATAADPQHPKFTDPAWSSYNAGEKIQKGLAYKNGPKA